MWYTPGMKGQGESRGGGGPDKKVNDDVGMDDGQANVALKSMWCHTPDGHDGTTEEEECVGVEEEKECVGVEEEKGCEGVDEVKGVDGRNAHVSTDPDKLVEVIDLQVLALGDDRRSDGLRTSIRPENWVLPHNPTSWPYSPEVHMAILLAADTASDHRICALKLYQLGKTNISARHLHDMKAGSVVGDEVISLMSALVNAVPEHDCYALHPELMTTIQTWHGSDKNHSKKTKANWDKMKAKWDDSRYLLLPANKRECHWILNVADREEKVVYHQDNLHGMFPQLMVSLLAWLEEVEGTGTWREEVAKPPEQLVNDCAIGVTAGMLYFVKHRHLVKEDTFTGKDLRRMRGRVFAMILFSSLDPPSDLDLMATGLKRFYKENSPSVQDYAARPTHMPRPLTSPSDDYVPGVVRCAGTGRAKVQFNEELQNYYLKVKSIINSKFLEVPVQLSIIRSEDINKEYLSPKDHIPIYRKFLENRVVWDFEGNFKVITSYSYTIHYLSSHQTEAWALRQSYCTAYQ